jgi:hypothetical protein
MRNHWLLTAILAGSVGLAGLTLMPGTAEADGYRRHGPHRHGHYRPYYPPRPPVYYAPRPHYYRPPPPVYYAPPPYFYRPPAYYAPPSFGYYRAPSFGFGVTIR